MPSLDVAVKQREDWRLTSGSYSQWVVTVLMSYSRWVVTVLMSWED